MHSMMSILCMMEVFLQIHSGNFFFLGQPPTYLYCIKFRICTYLIETFSISRYMLITNNFLSKQKCVVFFSIFHLYRESSYALGITMHNEKEFMDNTYYLRLECVLPLVP